MLLRKGVKLRTASEVHRVVQGNPLQDNLYWLGVLATDGNVYKNRIKIAVQRGDTDWLQQFANLTGANLLSEPKNCVSVAFHSPPVAEYLFSIGITPAKSLTLNYTGIISWDFVRGVIDGDGTITISKQGLPYVRIFSASLKFLLSIQSFLTAEGIKTCYPKIVNGRTYALCIIRSLDVLITYSKLYYQKELPCLERKHSKFGSAIQEWIAKKTAKSANVLKNAELAGFRYDTLPGQV